MGLLNETYIPELELYGDKYEVWTFKRARDSKFNNIKPNYTALELVIGKSPRSKTFEVEEQKIFKLISAIVLTSVNTGNLALTEDAKLLIEKVVKILYPMAESVDFGISYHWGNIYWEINIRINGKHMPLWYVRHEPPQRHPFQVTTRLAPFKRNKGNKVTCMRKVERLRVL